jgi:hypothetical protein
LVNDVTIVADAKPEALSLTYFHIELDTHEAILAEGLAVETFQRDNPHAFDKTTPLQGGGILRFSAAGSRFCRDHAT